MIIRKLQFENQPIVNSHFSPAIPPHFLWSAEVPELNLMTGERCTLRSDAIFSTKVGTPLGRVRLLTPNTADAPVLTNSLPAGNSRGFACLVVAARNNTLIDGLTLATSPAGSSVTYAQWSYTGAMVIFENSYIGSSAGVTPVTVNTNGIHCVVFGKQATGRYFISVNGIKSTNGFYDGNAANLIASAGQWYLSGVQSGYGERQQFAMLAVWPNTPADIISDEYGRDPWKLFGSRNAPTQLYQPADSVLVPPVLSNPNVSDITQTTVLPSVKVEF